MKQSNQSDSLHTRLVILALLSINLVACGGGTSANSTLNSNNETYQVDSNPSFSWERVDVSNLYKPSGDIEDTAPNFTWKVIEGASDYLLGYEDVATATQWQEHHLAISNSQLNCSDSTCTYQPNDINFAVGDQKAWWVRAKVAGVWQAWSSPHVFNIVADSSHMPETPSVLQPISPAGHITDNSPDFSWSELEDASAYQLGYENQDGSNWYEYLVLANQANCTNAVCTFQTGNTQTEGDKTWWFRANINNSWGQWSRASDYTVTQQTPTYPRGTLINAKLVKSKSANLIIPYAIKAYDITYSSIDTNGEAITLSGLLVVPQKRANKKSPFLSYQHGTRFLNKNRPTTNYSGLIELGGLGYIVSAPDYIGYGASASASHPYIHADSYATTSIDMLRASKVFLQQQNIAVNDQLFIAGYSEGGYATLALQKAIQESYSDEFTVTASAAGAGPFDISTTAKIVASKRTNKKPAFMSFVLQSYDSIYDLNSIEEMYQAPYVETIKTMFDGLHSSGTINDNLTTKTADLFMPDFLQRLRGDGELILKDKLAQNNIYDWTPQAPTRLFHSKYDEVVPYSNAIKAIETMRANGAQNVSLKRCHLGPFLGSHVNCAVKYLRDAKFFFGDYNPEL